MAAKMEEPILHVFGWLNGRIVLAVLRSYSRMICRACLSIPLCNRETDWESGSGLGLAQWIACQNSFVHTHTKLFCFLPKLKFPSLSWSCTTRTLHMDDGQKHPKESWTQEMTAIKNIQEIYWCKVWELGIKIRYLSVNGSKK